MSNWDPKGANLIFIFSPPRAGSTMLRMVIESHSRIAGGPEPHILPPLKYTCYFDRPHAASYDILNASIGLREFVDRLPDGVEAYLDACRSYARELYQRALTAKIGAEHFLDKTPQNALEWRFITRLFPNAKYIVLVRHPLGVFNSISQTFFMGDYPLTEKDNTDVPNYVREIAQFLRESNVSHLVVRYEDMVTDSVTQANRIARYLGLEYEHHMVAYGSANHIRQSSGDPISAHKLNRPVMDFIDKWVSQIATNDKNLMVAHRVIGSIADQDLNSYGYPRNIIFHPFDIATQSSKKEIGKRVFSWYLFKRRTYFTLRWLVRNTFLGEVVRSLQYYCSVLLRDRI